MLAIRSGRGCLDIFLSVLGDGPIKTEILSQRAVIPKTTDEPIGRKQENRDSLAEAKYDGQSLQEVKISGLVYTL